MQKSIFLVVPTIRDLVFFTEWGDAFQECHVLIVEDRDKKTVTLPHTKFKSITHLCWGDIVADFGKDEWIFSRHNAGIRSYGFLKAYQAGADVIITLDDDCFPVGDPAMFVSSHVSNLMLKAPEKWCATYPDPKWMFTRGFPYEVREKYPVMVSHGIWSGALDLDGKTESQLPGLLSENSYPPLRQFIPYGYYYPMCSMNLAFTREATPLMFFPMMGENHKGKLWGIDRYDDIWAGVISKKIMDHLGWSVVSGSPYIDHRKKSNISHNKLIETMGMEINERFWKWVEEVRLTENSVEECFLEVASQLPDYHNQYGTNLREAMRIWIRNFDTVKE